MCGPNEKLNRAWCTHPKMMGHVILIMFLFLLTSCGHSSQGLSPTPADRLVGVLRQIECGAVEDCFFQAREAYLDGDVRGAVLQIQDFLKDDPPPPWKGRARLLLARAQDGLGDPSAVKYYEETLKDLPQLGDYILFYLGRSYLKNGQALKAAQVLEGLHKHYPSSLLRSQALYLAAGAYAQAEEDALAITGFETFLRLYPEDPQAASALYLIGQLRLKQNEISRAVEDFRRVVWEYPQDPVATSARTELEGLASRGMVIPVPTPNERLYQAKALYRAAKYQEAVRAFKETLAASPDKSARDEARLYLGISLVQLRRWSEAIPVFEALLKGRPAGDTAGEALSWMGRAALRLGDLDKLLWVRKTFRTAYPDRVERAKALWFLILHYEDKKDDLKAIKFCRELIESFPQDSLAQEAHWHIAWIHYKNGRLQAAQKVMDELLSRYANSAFKPQTLYWKAKLLERNGNIGGAQEVYGRLCDDHARTYYCHRTRKRLEDLLPQENSRPNLEAFRPPKIQWQVSGAPASSVSEDVVGSSELQEEPEELTGDEQYRRARELMLIGLSDDATREMSALVGRYTGDRRTLLFLADRLYALGAFDQALRIIRLYFQEVLEKGDPKIPDHFWEEAYPLGMMDQIIRLIGPDRLDPYLVASIIREESGYDPSAVSRAGAVGLMQVMPETGRRVAIQLGLKDFQPDQLLDHELNIKLGARYLTHLFEQFKDNLIFTIAAYNAGPEAVTEWIGRADYQNLDEFVEQIPFSETRLYVKKVLRSYYEYLSIHPSPPGRVS